MCAYVCIRVYVYICVCVCVCKVCVYVLHSYYSLHYHKCTEDTKTSLMKRPGARDIWTNWAGLWIVFASQSIRGGLAGSPLLVLVRVSHSARQKVSVC